MDEKLMMYSNIKKVKQKAALFYALIILANIPYIGYVLAIGAMIMQFMFCYDLSKISQSKSLFRNALIVLVCNTFLSLVGIVFGIIFYAESFNIDFESIDFFMFLMPIFYTILAILALIFLLIVVFLFFIYKELSFITNQKFLLLGYIFIVGAICFSLMCIYTMTSLIHTSISDDIFFKEIFMLISGILSLILGLIGLILQITGWVNFKDLRNSQNGEWIFKYEWLFMDNEKETK